MRVLKLATVRFVASITINTSKRTELTSGVNAILWMCVVQYRALALYSLRKKERKNKGGGIEDLNGQMHLASKLNYSNMKSNGFLNSTGFAKHIRIILYRRVFRDRFQDPPVQYIPPGPKRFKTVQNLFFTQSINQLTKMTIPNRFWQLLVTFWSLLVTFYHFWSLFTTFGHFLATFWSLLVTFYHFFGV